METLPDSVLLIDDHENTKYPVCSSLRLDLSRVTCALNAEVGLKLAQSERFDLFLIDYQLPHSNGLHLADELHRLYQHIPKIIITAYPTLDQQLACRKRLIPWVKKPFIDDRLLNTVHLYLEASQQPQYDMGKTYAIWEQRWGLQDEIGL